jgi:hypothetical protein
MEQGWIYVLVNSSIPGFVKVGRTTRSSAERVAELSAATGVATPFVLAFEQAFTDCVRAEQDIHAELERRHLRLSQQREFFRGPPADIVRVVLQIAAEHGECAPIAGGTPASEHLEAGDRHFYGQGEVLQDVTEAIRCYSLAAKQGSLQALERMGAIYGRLTTKGRSFRPRAMRMLKEGARRGNYYCYIELARLYAVDGHRRNFDKAYDLFFARRADARCEEVEMGEYRYEKALRSYVAAHLEVGLPPAHLPELRQAGEGFIAWLSAALEQRQVSPEGQETLATVLRWAVANLRPRAAPKPATPDWRESWHARTRRMLGWKPRGSQAHAFPAPHALPALGGRAAPAIAPPAFRAGSR